jgi:hypothetical protein
VYLHSGMQSVWSVAVDTLEGGEPCQWVTACGSFGLRSFRALRVSHSRTRRASEGSAPEGADRTAEPTAERELELAPATSWEHPTLLARAVRFPPEEPRAGSEEDPGRRVGESSVAWLLVPVRGASPSPDAPPLKPTDVWMWSERRKLERYLRFGAPVTGIVVPPGGVRGRWPCVVVSLPSEVFVFRGRTLQHRFGVECHPAPLQPRSDWLEAASKHGIESPPPLQLWRPAVGMSGRFLAVASATAPADGTETDDSDVSLRSVTLDAAAGMVKLGRALGKAGQAVGAWGREMGERTSAVVLAAYHAARDAPEPARKEPKGDPLRGAASSQWTGLASALEESAARPLHVVESDAVGCITVVDLESERTLCHWVAHRGCELAQLALNSAGSALVSCDAVGQSLKLWRLLPPRDTSRSGDPILVARLERGVTPARIVSMRLNTDVSLIAALSSRGTVHLWHAGVRGVVPVPGDGLPTLAGNANETALGLYGSELLKARAVPPPSTDAPAFVADVMSMVQRWGDPLDLERAVSLVPGFQIKGHQSSHFPIGGLDWSSARGSGSTPSEWGRSALSAVQDAITESVGSALEWRMERAAMDVGVLGLSEQEHCVVWSTGDGRLSCGLVRGGGSGPLRATSSGLATVFGGGSASSAEVDPRVGVWGRVSAVPVGSVWSGHAEKGWSDWWSFHRASLAWVSTTESISPGESRSTRAGGAPLPLVTSVYPSLPLWVRPNIALFPSTDAPSRAEAADELGEALAGRLGGMDL